MKTNKPKSPNKRIENEVKEDLYFAKIAEERMKQKNIKWVSHEDAWKVIKN